MIAIIIGTKAELIKCIPVMKELEKREIDYFFIHTGQHNINEIIRDFKLKKPDKVLYSPPKSSSKFMVKTHKAIFWFLPLIFKIRKILNEIKPSHVLYHGDTLSSAAAAMASSSFFGKKNWKNAHLEAGLRSYDRRMPEEINRIVADHVSDYLFAPTEKAKQNLLKEGVDEEKIFVTGTC